MAGGKLILVGKGSKKPLYMKRRKKKKTTKAQIGRIMGIIPGSLKPDYSIKMTFLSPYSLLNDGIFSNSSLSQTTGALSFQLQDMPDHALYTSMFDQYRFNKVVVKFIPTMTTVVNRPYDDTTTISVVDGCRLAAVIDRDDDATPSTADGYEKTLHRQGSRSVSAGQPMTITLIPTRLAMVYRTATTTGYKVDNNYKEFNDCAQHDIRHFGVKYALQPYAPANCFQYRVQLTYYLSFKDRRH